VTDILITDLRGGYKILTVHPWTEFVIVSIFDKNQDLVEDFIVEAGVWREVDIANMGNITIGRPITTVVDWGISVDRDANIGGSSWNSTAFDAMDAVLDAVALDVDSLTDELTAVTTDDGIWLDPDWSTDIVCSALDIGEGESYSYSWSMDGYTACYAKFLATTFAESTTVVFGTSETPGWATGNTAYFDMDPFSTVTVEGIALNDTLGTYGTCVPILNTYGTWIPGPYGLLTITNNNDPDFGFVGNTADSVIAGMTIIILKRK